jgi:hypothetical protein
VKIIVVDVDDTLALTPRVSRLLWFLSSLLQTIARRLQKVNVGLVKLLDEYEKVIILTGRDVADCESTKRQLMMMRVHFDEIICCPKAKLVHRWKASLVHELAEKHPGDVSWVDDELMKGF